MKCEIVDGVSLASITNQYLSISYEAGDCHSVEVIYVNGHPFNAFARLGHALRQARYFWSDRFHKATLLVWADQICINQNNSQERMHQVQLMGDIYGTSSNALVSLSCEDDIGGRAERLHHVTTLNSTSLGDSFLATRKFIEFHISWNVFMSTFLHSPWWSRAWIRQEFIRS